ncbi:MAG: RNA methyltransferase [Chlamydiota bacterium]
MKEITSHSNPIIKQVVRLRERKERDETHLFLIEGYRELSRALMGKVPIETLFIAPEFFLGSNENQLIQDISSFAEIIRCPPSVFSKMSYRDRPDGLLAVAKITRRSLDDLSSIIQKSPNPFLVIAESIEKPGNLGSILRSSDGVKVDAVIVCDPCTDVFNPNVVRASVGTLFTMPVIETTTDLLLPFLHNAKIAILAATPHAAKEYYHVDMKKPLAIVVGTEQYGLSEKWMKESSLQVRIPMLGIADSLNVATATTLLLYEVLRQRSFV